VRATATLPPPTDLPPVNGPRMWCAGFATRLHPKVMRQAARHFMATHGAWPGLIEDATLVLHELLSNTRRHLPKPSRAWVNVYLYVQAGGSVRIEVYDPSPSPPRPRRLALGEHGRGLMIVSELSSQWGYVRLYPLGKYVFAELSALGRVGERPGTVGPVGPARSAPPPPAGPVVGPVGHVEAEQRGRADDHEGAEADDDHAW
jgi:anti-sigma regulatory factor (Ser/Thr protein kinase)